MDKLCDQNYGEHYVIPFQKIQFNNKEGENNRVSHFWNSTFFSFLSCFNLFYASIYFFYVFTMII